VRFIHFVSAIFVTPFFELYIHQYITHPVQYLRESLKLVYCLSFGLLLIYIFKVIALSGLVYFSLILISFLHYQKSKKQNNIGIVKGESEDLEDIL